MTPADRELIVLGTLNNTMELRKLVGTVNMASCLIEAGMKLLIDAEGPAVAWAQLRDTLEMATERARILAHPQPTPID